MKKKVLYLFLGILLLICTCSWLRYRVVNKQFYQFVKNIKSEFKYVKSIDLLNYGPHCTIMVFMEENNCDYERLETVFIKIMTEIAQKSNFQYFLKRHNETASGELAFFHICFYQEGIKDKTLCRYTSYKDFEVWELESDRSVKFRVSDYLQ